ncbi:hypothetical protein C7N43_27355 [Sphingobacteriales bacterium UPWRP_1]|nr:hypothetical protein C7N43_27355 [Sphingobacteriales bacterium UPWRP_1]
MFLLKKGRVKQKTIIIQFNILPSMFSQAYTLQITNLQGQPVMPAQTLYAGNNAVYLPNLPAGMYFVTLTSGKQVQTLRWVVQ